jgi:transmembrane sensor
MRPNNELIARFLKRECTAEEAEQVQHFFENNPHLLEEYWSEAEWQTFYNDKNLEPVRSEQLLANILQKLQLNVEVPLFSSTTRLFSRIAAAICVFMLYLLWQHSYTHTDVKLNRVADNTVVPQWRTTENKRQAPMYLTLDDGSRVILQACASIKYQLPFRQKTRHIYLTGKAKFFVAKDKHRPFTVFAGPLATTALGTVFEITSWPAGSHTKVRLLSGKVKVVPYHHANPNAQAVYLLPGKELIFHNQKQSLWVSSFQNHLAVPTASVQPGSTLVKGDTLNFVNQRLPEVINTLQEAYRVRISSNLNLKKYYFTGQFNSRTNGFESVLNTITTLNKLHYALQPDSTYTIFKHTKLPQPQPPNKL